MHDIRLKGLGDRSVFFSSPEEIPQLPLLIQGEMSDTVVCQERFIFAPIRGYSDFTSCLGLQTSQIDRHIDNTVAQFSDIVQDMENSHDAFFSKT